MLIFGSDIAPAFSCFYKEGYMGQKISCAVITDASSPCLESRGIFEYLAPKTNLWHSSYKDGGFSVPVFSDQVILMRTSNLEVLARLIDQHAFSNAQVIVVPTCNNRRHISHDQIEAWQSHTQARLVFVGGFDHHAFVPGLSFSSSSPPFYRSSDSFFLAPVGPFRVQTKEGEVVLKPSTKCAAGVMASLLVLLGDLYRKQTKRFVDTRAFSICLQKTVTASFFYGGVIHPEAAFWTFKDALDLMAEGNFELALKRTQVRSIPSPFCGRFSQLMLYNPFVQIYKNEAENRVKKVLFGDAS